jgi:hypothetical protein
MVHNLIRHKCILAASSVGFSFLSSSSIFSSFFSFMPVKFPYYANRSLNLICHNPKLLEPSNFTTSNLVALDI